MPLHCSEGLLSPVSCHRPLLSTQPSLLCYVSLLPLIQPYLLSQCQLDCVPREQQSLWTMKYHLMKASTCVLCLIHTWLHAYYSLALKLSQWGEPGSKAMVIIGLLQTLCLPQYSSHAQIVGHGVVLYKNCKYASAYIKLSIFRAWLQC